MNTTNILILALAIILAFLWVVSIRAIAAAFKHLENNLLGLTASIYKALTENKHTVKIQADKIAALSFLVEILENERNLFQSGFGWYSDSQVATIETEFHKFIFLPQESGSFSIELSGGPYCTIDSVIVGTKAVTSGARACLFKGEFGLGTQIIVSVRNRQKIAQTLAVKLKVEKGI